MNRTLTTSMSAAVAAQSAKPVFLYEGEFDGGTLRLWTGYGTLVMSGQNWAGAGHLLGVAPIGESLDVRADGLQLSLSGMPSSLVSTMLSNARYGKPGRLWLGMMETLARLELPGTAGNYASTPDSVAVSITGDIDIRVKVAADDWTPLSAEALLAKDDGTNREWGLIILTSGNLRFRVNVGTPPFTNYDSTVAPSVVDGAVIWLRVTRSAATGNVIFYTSSDGLTWPQLGATVANTAGNIVDTIAPLSISLSASTEHFSGRLYYAEIRNGINGTVVAKFDPNEAVRNATSFTSSTGEVWTVNQSGTPPARLVHDDGSIMMSPYLAFRGRFDRPEIDDTGETCMITVRYENVLIDLERVRVRHYSKEDQEINYPGDKGFDFVPSLQDKTFTWGISMVDPGAAYKARQESRASRPRDESASGD